MKTANMQRWTSFTVLVVLSSLVAAAWLMLTENREHMLEILVYTLVLFCPLLHLFHTRHRRERGNHGVARRAS